MEEMVAPPPPSDPVWIPVKGVGANDSVMVLLDIGQGRLLVAGAFTEIAGSIATRTALGYAETFFTNLGNGLHSSSLMGTYSSERFYLLQLDWSSSPKKRLRYWDATTSTWGEFGGMQHSELSSYFHAIHMHGDSLYVGQQRSGWMSPPIQEIVVVRDETAPYGWRILPGRFSGPVTALATFNGQLVAAGEFTRIFTDMDTLNVDHVAVYDYSTNTWSHLADGLNADVTCLVERDGVLYAGSRIDPMADDPPFGLARLAIGDDAWQRMMPGQQDYFDVEGGPGEVHTIAVAPDGSGYFGGSFTMEGSHGSGTNLASFGTTPDDVHPAGAFNGAVLTLAFSPFADSNVLFAGGGFTMNGAEPMPYFAQATITTGIREAADKAPFTLSPNPAQEQVKVCLEAGSAGRVLRVMDATGRIVVDSFTDSPCTELDVAHLSAGTYVVQLEDGRSTRTATFVKR